MAVFAIHIASIAMLIVIVQLLCTKTVAIVIYTWYSDCVAILIASGFARNMDWSFVEAESSDGKCVLELVDSEETKKVRRPNPVRKEVFICWLQW